MERLTHAVWMSALLATAALGACAYQAAGLDASATVTRNLTYSPPDWPEQLAGDLYLPASRGRAPALLLVHGGGWDGRDRSDMDGLASALVARGYAVLNIDYRLAPTYRYPAPVDDVKQAVQYLGTHAVEFGIDAHRLGGWGYSAGAQLVAMAAMGESPAPLRAVVAGGMPCDLPRYPHSPLITAFLGANFAEQPELWRQASPIDRIAGNTPPMYLYHGTWDRLVDYADSVAMKQQLDAHGVPAELHAVHGLGHLATFVLAWGARRDAIAFLDRNLRGSTDRETARRAGE